MTSQHQTQGEKTEKETFGSNCLLAILENCLRLICGPARTLLELDKVRSLRGLGGVAFDHVVVHESGPPEQRETSGTAKHAAKHVLRGLL